MFREKIRVIKKILGVIFIVFGFLSLLAPLTIGVWLFFAFLEFFGFKLLFQGKIGNWLKNRLLGNTDPMAPELKSILIDGTIIFFSFVLAAILWKYPFLKGALTATRELGIIGSFLAGMAFTSVFTAAPAAIILVEIAQENSLLLVALFGGLGSLAGDLIIFRFVKDRLTKDAAFILGKLKQRQVAEALKHRLFRRILPIVGALIVISPFPDELGVALMGISQVPNSVFIPLSFSLNFIGILLVGVFSKILI